MGGCAFRVLPPSWDSFLALSVPAIGTQLAGRQPNGLDDALQGLELQGSELELITDVLPQLLAPLGGGVAVLLQVLEAFFPFQLHDGAAGDQLHVTGGTGEVQVLAAIHDGRTGGAHMDGFGAVGVQEFDRLLELGAPNNGIIHKEQLLFLDQLVDGDLLHLSHLVPLRLAGGHEAPCPGGGVFDEGTGEGDAALVGVANGVRGAGVGDAADVVDVLVVACLSVAGGHDGAVAIAHGLHVDPFISRGGIAVIRPQEGTDVHLVPRRHQLGDPVCGDLYNLTRPQLPLLQVVPQLLIGKGLEGHAVSILSLADEHRQASHPISGGDDRPVLLQDEDGCGALDGVLGEADAFGKAALLVDHGRHQFRGVDLAASHGVKMPAAEGQVLLDKGIGVVDDADDADGIGAQVGADEQGLGVGVADAADGRGALHLVKDVLEFGAEGGILDVVNLPLQPNGRGIGRHAAPPCAQMRMIVYSIK